MSNRQDGGNIVCNLHTDTLNLILSWNKDELSKQDVEDRSHLCHGQLHTHAGLHIGQFLSLVM